MANEITEFFPDHTGNIRPLGRVVDRSQPLPLFSSLRLKMGDLIPESKWEEFEDDDGPIKVKDQDGIGACNPHAGASGMERSRYLAGLDHVEISPWWPYGKLTGGVDRGSNIGQLLELLQNEGAPRDELVGYKNWKPRAFTPEMAKDAGRFKIEIGELITTKEEFATAYQKRWTLNFSLCVGAGFDNLDADDCVRPGRGFDNHAVCGTGSGMKRGRNGKWKCKWQNSWTTRWGKNGYAWIWLDDILTGRYAECYVLRVPSLDPLAVNPPNAQFV